MFQTFSSAFGCCLPWPCVRDNYTVLQRTLCIIKDYSPTLLYSFLPASLSETKNNEHPVDSTQEWPYTTLEPQISNQSILWKVSSVKTRWKRKKKLNSGVPLITICLTCLTCTTTACGGRGEGEDTSLSESVSVLAYPVPHTHLVVPLVSLSVSTWVDNMLHSIL